MYVSEFVQFIEQGKWRSRGLYGRLACSMNCTRCPRRQNEQLEGASFQNLALTESPQKVLRVTRIFFRKVLFVRNTFLIFGS